jgi:co-chaperonin GroES (HSP10)
MSIALREDYVAIEVLKRKKDNIKMSEGGIAYYDEEQNREPCIVGYIRYAGPGKSLDLPGNQRKEMDLKVGHKVTFEPGCGKERFINGTKLLIIEARFVTFVHLADNLEISIKEKK